MTAPTQAPAEIADAIPMRSVVRSAVRSVVRSVAPGRRTGPSYDPSYRADLDANGQVDAADLGASLAIVGEDSSSDLPRPGDLDGEISGADRGLLPAA
jgi:hypothetical protein